MRKAAQGVDQPASSVAITWVLMQPPGALRICASLDPLQPIWVNPSSTSGLGISSQDALVEAGWEGPAEYGDEDELFGFSSSADHVQHLLQALSERDREVLTCRFLLGLSVRETAVRMGLTEGNVKISQFRALKRAADLEYVVSNT